MLVSYPIWEEEGGVSLILLYFQGTERDNGTGSEERKREDHFMLLATVNTPTNIAQDVMYLPDLFSWDTD